MTDPQELLPAIPTRDTTSKGVFIEASVGRNAAIQLASAADILQEYAQWLEGTGQEQSGRLKAKYAKLARERIELLRWVAMLITGEIQSDPDIKRLKI